MTTEAWQSDAFDWLSYVPWKKKIGLFLYNVAVIICLAFLFFLVYISEETKLLKN